jgi:hypothetical protein
MWEKIISKIQILSIEDKGNGGFRVTGIHMLVVWWRNNLVLTWIFHFDMDVCVILDNDTYINIHACPIKLCFTYALYFYISCGLPTYLTGFVLFICQMCKYLCYSANCSLWTTYVCVCVIWHSLWGRCVI